MGKSRIHLVRVYSNSVNHSLNAKFALSEFLLKTVAFIADKKNPATQNIFIRFSIESFIANITLYVLSWPKLNFGCYLTFEIMF